MVEKLTEAAADYARRYGEHFRTYIGPCPWNPFPRTSHWGRMIEQAYRRLALSNTETK